MIEHTSVNSSPSWGQILNPFRDSVLHLLHQRVQDLYEALLRFGPTWSIFRWYRVETGWPCLLTRVPSIEQVDEHELVFPTNLIEMPLTYRLTRFKPINSTNLRSWCPQNTATATQKLLSFSLSAHRNVYCHLLEACEHELSRNNNNFTPCASSVWLWHNI